MKEALDYDQLRASNSKPKDPKKMALADEEFNRCIRNAVKAKKKYLNLSHTTGKVEKRYNEEYKMWWNRALDRLMELANLAYKQGARIPLTFTRNFVESEIAKLMKEDSIMLERAKTNKK